MVKTSDIKPQTLGERLKRGFKEGFDKFADKLAANKAPKNEANEAKDAEVNVTDIETAAQIKAAARGDKGIDR